MNEEYMDVEKDIDFKAIFFKLWKNRKIVFKWCGIAILAGLVISFSIPKKYTSSAKLAPEFNSKSSLSSSLNNYAQLMGFNINTAVSTRDAVYPDLYPDIVAATPFMTDLFSIPVTFRWKKENVETTLFDYLENYQKKTWWSVIFSLPFKILEWAVSLVVKEEDDEEESTDGAIVVDDFKLTKKQMQMVKSLRHKIYINVDKKTFVVTITTTMQDPVVAAVVTRTVLDNLQAYITRYRTDKSKKDLEYTLKLYAEAKSNYESAQGEYARYADAHQGIVTISGRGTQQKLQNESELAYQLYNQMAQKLQLAKAKVQEETPVYKILQPPVVPLRKSSPSKVKILFVMMFLAVCGSCGWILFGDDIKNFFKEDE